MSAHVHSVPRAVQPRDVTTPAEYDAVLNILPLHLRNLIRPFIHRVEEIILDRSGYLQIKFDGVRIAYDIQIATVDLDAVMDGVGRPREDGRRGIPGTLHRVSFEKDDEGHYAVVTIRVAKVIAGVAECLRGLIERSRGILLVGPPAVGKSTLLRDIARIRGNLLLGGLIILDSANELTGDGPDPHPYLKMCRRIQVGDPDQQTPKLIRARRNHGAEEQLLDELVTREDVVELIKARRNGVTTIATAHGAVLPDLMNHPELVALLGVYEVTGGGYAKKSDAVFEAAVVIHGKGRYEVFPDLNAAVLEMLAGQVPVGMHVGRWPAEFNPVDAI